MEARIIRQFGVKGCRKEMSLLRGNNSPIVQRGKRLRISGYRFNERRADEDRVVRVFRSGNLFDFGNIKVSLKGIHLASKRIPLHFDIHESEQRLIAADIF